ncbi:MAG: DUF1294 domain-containing protein [Burkholderiaceae bacterium]|nr:DUF1294 domain-containing protein [Burkholderiaceae bacterium]
MQKLGTVVRWDTTRAFGFIRSPHTVADVFFHLRYFQGVQPPRECLAVQYEEIHIGSKGPRAMAVQPYAGAQRAPPASSAAKGSAQGRNRSKAPASKPNNLPAHGARPSASRRPQPRTARLGAPKSGAAPSAIALLLMLGWAAFPAWGVWSGRLPWWLLGAVLAINVFTFAVYAIDKTAAQSGQWRTKESRLHLLTLAGGWPGAWVAQQWLRHKSSKPAFRAVYWATVVLHCIASPCLDGPPADFNH